jgi:hypothetical protein
MSDITREIESISLNAEYLAVAIVNLQSAKRNLAGAKILNEFIEKEINDIILCAISIYEDNEWIKQ